jgi:hypothetical protein
MRRRESHVPGPPLPVVAVPPRPSPPPDPNIPVDHDDQDDVDDQAETRLFRPRIDSLRTTRPARPNTQSNDRPSRSSRPSQPISRPGALILIPADVPSVRVRSDSDVELMDTRMSEAGIVPRRSRRRSLSTDLFLAGVLIALTMLLLHEVALAAHLPWLDPRNFFEKLGR